MILAFAVHDTEENQRTSITRRCLLSLRDTTDLTKYRLFFIDNNSCQETKDLLLEFQKHNPCTIITNEENIGTAEAINKAWKYRYPGEHCMKIDNDVVWHQSGWVELMAECLHRDKEIGIIGLKRKDCWERPSHLSEDYRSELQMIPQKPGEKWLVVEKAKHIIGTCQMYNSALLDKIGYLYQPSLYGYDDVMASWRSQLAGFKNVFLPQIEIDHIDNGGTPYQSWKEKHSGEVTQQVIREVNEMIAGTKSIYYTPFLPEYDPYTGEKNPYLNEV